MSRIDGFSPGQFQGVRMNDIPIREGLLSLYILLYDIDFVEGEHNR